MAAKELLAKLKARREKSVEVAEGKTVQFERPLEADFPSLLSFTDGKGVWNITLEHVRKYVTGWKGITEADMIGSAIGSSDEEPFDPALWAEVVGDRFDWQQKVGQAILDSVVDHITERDKAAKN
jgi:hypothetical protein